MSGTIEQLIANPVSAQPGYWQQGINNLTTLKDFQARNALAQIYQDPTVVDPTTGAVDQGRLNALIAASPQASWNAAPAMQAQGQAGTAQAEALNQQTAGHLARLKVMSGEMSDLLQSGQPVTAAQIGARLNSLGKEGILTPGDMSGITADLNSQPPGADLTGWLRNHMAANLSAAEQVQNASSQPYHYDAGGYLGVAEGNPNRPGYMAPGTVVGKTLTPEGATDIATIQFPDGHTQQVPRGQVPAILGGTAGAKEIPTYEGTIGAHEGLTADPRDPTTVGGFRPDTWQSFAAANPTLFAGMSPQQIMAARSDPNLNRQGIAWVAQQNAGVLSKNGAPVNGTSLGIAHWLGARAAAQVVQAPDSAPVSQFVSAAALAANPELRTMTVGQMKQRYANVPNPGFLGGGGGTATAAAPTGAGRPAPSPAPPAAPATPGIQVGGAAPPPPGPAGAATGAPAGIGAAFAAQGAPAPRQYTVAPPPVIRAAPIPAGRLSQAGSPTTNALMAGVNLAQATPVLPGAPLAAGGNIGQPATLAPAPNVWGAPPPPNAVNYNLGPRGAAPTPPVVTPQPPPPQATPQPAPQAGVSPAPGVVEAKKAAALEAANRSSALINQFTASSTVKPILAGMEQELNASGGTGFGTAHISALRQALERLGLTPAAVDVATPQAALESFKKLSAQLQGAQLGTVGGVPTDDRQSLIEASNPSVLNSTAGNRSIIHVLQGTQQAIDVMGRAWMASPDYQANPGSFDSWRTKFTAVDPKTGGRFDPRAFWLNNMPPDEQQAYLKNMTPKGMAEFKKNWAYARGQGWVDQLPGQPATPAGQGG